MRLDNPVTADTINASIPIGALFSAVGLKGRLALSVPFIALVLGLVFGAIWLAVSQGFTF